MLITSADIKRPRFYPIAITQYHHPHHHCLLLPRLISHQASHTLYPTNPLRLSHPTVFAVIVHILIPVSEILSIAVCHLSFSKSLSFSSAYSFRRLIRLLHSRSNRQTQRKTEDTCGSKEGMRTVPVIQSRVVMAPIVDASSIVQIKLNGMAEDPPTTMAETERRSKG
ncbi:hypothetical protein Bca4012_092314 [Brassica carinata]